MPAKPNYGFEKRQRELEKKRKKADKADQKRAAPTGPQPPEGGVEQNKQAEAG
ncbi:MAG TPA: hypothetical protein VIL30_22265 [Ramlibacter sp.]